MLEQAAANNYSQALDVLVEMLLEHCATWKLYRAKLRSRIAMLRWIAQVEEQESLAEEEAEFESFLLQAWETIRRSAMQEQ